MAVDGPLLAGLGAIVVSALLAFLVFGLPVWILGGREVRALVTTILRRRPPDE
jgi:hypothetical protein